eukprot:Anaeramoba_ignava/c20975_g1_i2.p2 GENE.c20975_g1_i2~~c20975_g1_i2.p2  ORF type:complete len:193 (+),score=74.94 c20975_g1_i2:2129-2707(+)
MLYSDHQTYEGEWENDLRSGSGTFINKNIKYYGEWKNNLPNGKGNLTISNKDITNNEIQDRKNLHTKYIGNFKDGKPHDENMHEDIVNRYSFDGSIKFGEKNGKGKMNLKNEVHFSGNWKNGKFEINEENFRTHFLKKPTQDITSIYEDENTKSDEEMMIHLSNEVNPISLINENPDFWLIPPDENFIYEWK